MKDSKGHGSNSRGASAAHSTGVQQVMPSMPEPGTQAWLAAKSGGPKWSWQDATGVQRTGYMQTYVDRGGTDVSHYMRRDPGGELDIVSGSRAKGMTRVK